MAEEAKSDIKEEEAVGVEDVDSDPANGTSRGEVIGAEDNEALNQSLHIKIKGFRKDNLASKKKMNALLYKLFMEELKIAEAPLFSKGNRWIYVEFKSKEDKDIAISKLGSSSQHGKTFTFVENQSIFAVPIIAHPKSAAIKVMKKESIIYDYSVKKGESTLKYKSIPYKEELNAKFSNIRTSMEQCVEGVVTELKKMDSPIADLYGKAPHVDRIIPMTPFYGYATDAVFNIVEDENGDILLGTRSFRSSEAAKTFYLTPAEECIHISPPLIHLANDFTNSMKDLGMKAFNPTTSAGDVAGLFLQMNKCGEIIMTVLLCKDAHTSYSYELIVHPDEYVDDDPPDTRDPIVSSADNPSIILEDVGDKDEFMSKMDRQIYINQIKEVSPALNKYYVQKSKTLGFMSIYVNWSAFYSLLREKHRTKYYHHVVGKPTIKEELNNVFYEICPYRQWFPQTSALPQIIGVLTEVLHLDKTSSLVVASDYRYLTLYFAEKCKSVISINLWGNKISMPPWLANRLCNVETIQNNPSSATKLGKAIRKLPTIESAIIWGTLVHPMIRRLFNTVRIKQVAFVFKSVKSWRQLKFYMTMSNKRLYLSKVYPFDSAARSTQTAIIALFTESPNATKESSVLGKRRGTTLPAIKDIRGRKSDAPGAHWNERRDEPVVPPRWSEGNDNRYHDDYYEERCGMPNECNTLLPPSDGRISRTLNELGSFMRNQMMVNEMLHVGMQRISTDSPSSMSRNAPSSSYPSSRNGNPNYYSNNRSDDVSVHPGGSGVSGASRSGNYNRSLEQGYERRRDTWSRHVSNPNDKFNRSGDSNRSYWD